MLTGLSLGRRPSMIINYMTYDNRTLNATLITVFWFCFSIEVGLVLLDIFVNWQKISSIRAIRRMFNITREDGIASLFAVVQTFAVAAVCWVIYWIKTNQISKRKRATICWLIIAIFFTYMAIDDGALVHERIGTAFKHWNSGRTLPSYGWQFILMPGFVLMGIFLGMFLWRQGPGHIRRDWLFIAILCLGIAVVIDYIEGTKSAFQFLSNHLPLSKAGVSHFAKSLEEFLEMLGMTMFLVIFLRHLFLLTYKTEICFSNGKASLAPLQK